MVLLAHVDLTDGQDGLEGSVGPVGVSRKTIDDQSSGAAGIAGFLNELGG